VLSPFAQDSVVKGIRHLQRKIDRQRRAANPQNYDEQGRTQKASKKKPLSWKKSQGEARTQRRLASKERKRAAHRKSQHGKLAHEITAMGNTIILEKISYKAWQKHFGRSVNERAPGMFLAHLRRTVASTGGTLFARLDTHHQALAILSWLWSVRQKAPVAADARMLLRDWPHSTGSVFCVPGGLSRCFSSRPSFPAHVWPVCRSLAKWGSPLASRTRLWFFNERKKGRSCLEAWEYPEQELVGSKVKATFL
jgi:hypothetical protein